MNEPKCAEHSGYIRNSWYAVALAREVGRKPVREWCLGVPIVLFRKTNGELVALQDRCPHRLAPLSLGKVVEDELQCRYHGFQFDATGRCTKIPGEKVIPSAVRVGAFPTVEFLGAIWVWPGDPERANARLLPEYPWYERPGFISRHLRMQFEAPFELIVDNLMDLTHVHFVHSILGADNLVHESEPMQVWETAGHVGYRRDLREGPFAARGIYMEITGEFIPPSVVTTASVPRRDDTNEIQGVPMSQVIHCLTPRTAASTSYLAVKSWNLLAKPHEIAAVEHQMLVTLTEDKEIIEAQYGNRTNGVNDVEEKLIRADRAAVMARRVYEKLLAREMSVAVAQA